MKLEKNSWEFLTNIHINNVLDLTVQRDWRWYWLGDICRKKLPILSIFSHWPEKKLLCISGWFRPCLKKNIYSLILEAFIICCRMGNKKKLYKIVNVDWEPGKFLNSPAMVVTLTLSFRCHFQRERCHDSPVEWIFSWTNIVLYQKETLKHKMWCDIEKKMFLVVRRQFLKSRNMAASQFSTPFKCFTHRNMYVFSFSHYGNCWSL